MKALGEFDFAASPVNAALVRDLHKGDIPGGQQPQRGADRRHRLGQDAPGDRRRGELHP